jgi:hypothetical protein
MATCADILGLWKSSLIVFDGSEEVDEDGNIRIFRDGAGKLKGEHSKAGSTIPLEVECTEVGGKVRIKLKEVNGQTTTVYSGRVILFVLKDALVIIKGRVQRSTTNGRRVVSNGDWSSEKPT